PQTLADDWSSRQYHFAVYFGRRLFHCQCLLLLRHGFAIFHGNVYCFSASRGISSDMVADLFASSLQSPWARHAHRSSELMEYALGGGVVLLTATGLANRRCWLLRLRR